MADDVTVDNGGITDYSVSTQELGDGSHVQEISLVHVDVNTASQITKKEDEASTASDGGVPILGVRNDTAADLTDTNGDYSHIATDSAGRVGITTFDGGAIDVNVTSTVNLTPGTGATDLGKAEDAAHSSGDVGVEMLAVRNDTAATTLTSANGDYSPIAVDSKGQLFITAGSTPVNVAVTSTTTVTPGTGATNLGKAEDAAHSSGDVGVMMLGVRNDSDSSFSGTNGDYTPINVDATGRVAVSLPSTVGGIFGVNWDVAGEIWDGFTESPASINSVVVTASSSGDTTLIAAPGSGIKILVLSFALIANEAVNVKFKGGTTDITGLFYLAANGGFVLPHNQGGWFYGGNNEALKINLSAAKAVGGVLTYVPVGTA